MFESSKNFLRLPNIVSKFRESLETSWELFKTFDNLFEESLEISTNSISDFREVPDI